MAEMERHDADRTTPSAGGAPISSTSPSSAAISAISAAPAAPAVSAIMAVYNGGSYLEEAVRSILAQSLTDFEFIIVDDGSTDGTTALLDRFARQDARIRIVHAAHQGVSAARNAALALVRAPLVAIMDADDVCMPERFARQVEFLNANPQCVAIGCEAMMIDPAGREIGVKGHPLTHREIDDRLMQVREAMTHPAVMLRAETVRRLGGYRSHLPVSEDYDLFLRLAEVGELANLPDVLFHYRLHAGSISVARMESQVRLSIECAREAAKRRGLGDSHRLNRAGAVDPDLDARVVTTMVIQGYLWRAYLLAESGAFSAIHKLLDGAMDYARAKQAPWQLIGDLHAARAMVHRREGNLTHSMVSSIKSLVHQPRRMLRGWRGGNSKPTATLMGNGKTVREN